MSSRREWLRSVATAALSLGLGAAGSARAAATLVEQRNLGACDQVSWDAVGELVIEQSPRQRLTVEAEPRLLPRLITEIRNGRLWIGLAPGRFQTREPIRFRLELAALRSVQAGGSGEIRIGRLTAGELSLSLAASTDIRLAHLIAQSLDTRIDGSGSLDISGGQVGSQRVAIGGSGDYRTAGLQSAEAEVSIDGSGSVQLAVTDRLNVRIDGSGDVEYRGRPRITQTLSGSGTLRPAAN